MFKLDAVQAFAAIVETGSITGAARRLALSKSVVSERLTELERALDAKLESSRSASRPAAGCWSLRLIILSVTVVRVRCRTWSSTRASSTAIAALLTGVSTWDAKS